MKKCLKCGQVKGIKGSHKFCHNCDGNVFEVTRKEVVIGDVKGATSTRSLSEIVQKSLENLREAVEDEMDYYNRYWNIGHEFVWGVDNLK